MDYNNTDIIIARATPIGKSALAIIRMSGEDLMDTIKTMWPNYIFQPNQIVLKKIKNLNSKTILDSCMIVYYQTPKSFTGEDMIEIYRSFYQNEPFVKVTDFAPQTKYTTGSNMCLVFPVVDRENARLIVVSCLDNLVKGAAGQAVQNMNLMSGLPETEGLGQLPLYP